MHRLIIAALLVGGVCLGMYNENLQNEYPRIEKGPNGEEYIKGELLVKFKSGTGEQEISWVIYQMNGERLFTHSNVDFIKVSVPQNRNVLEVCDLYKTFKSIEYAEPNYVLKLAFVPNDPMYQDQWGPPCIGAEQAWNAVQGNHSVIVAILDTGVDEGHPDLNGNVDTSIDYDFVNNDANAHDDFGHGTHVTGIVAAEINNATGVAGLQQVRIMAVKVGSSLGTILMDDLVAGINYAVQHGARVINMSLGSTAPSTPLEQACNNAYNAGVFLVASAGNSGNAQPMYPAAYNSVVGVSALADPYNIASWSSFGVENVELCAPGQGILSTMPRSIFDMLFLWLLGYSTNYDYMDGTSMACPYVVGVAAAYFCYRPNLTNTQVRNHMRSHADDLGLPGYDEYYGYGRVDMYPVNALVE